MKYDRVVPEHFVGPCDLSCAFHQCRDHFEREVRWNWSYNNGYPLRGRTSRESVEEHETRLWKILCGILCASETRPVFIPTTSKEEKMEELLEACPYAERVETAPSKHGRYTASIWLVRKHERNSV